MAVETLSTLADALGQKLPSLHKQWNRTAPVLSELTIEPGFGKNVAFDANLGGASAAAVAEGSDVVAGEFLQDLIKPATLSWAEYRGAFGMSILEINAAASSVATAPGELLNPFLEKLGNSIAAMTSLLESEVINGTGTSSGNPGIVGFLGGALPTAGGTYAGLAVNTYPLWSSTVLDNGGVPRTLTIDLLNQGDKSLFIKTGQKAEFAIADAGTWQKYASYFEAQRRYNEAGVYNTGADELYYKGIRIVRSKDMPAGTLILGSKRHVKLKYLPSTSIAALDAVMAQTNSAVSSNGDFMNTLGLPISLYSLAKTGSSAKFFLMCHAQMAVTRPNAFVVIKDIAV